MLKGFDLNTFILFHTVMLSLGPEFKPIRIALGAYIFLYLIFSVQDFVTLFNRFKEVNLAIVLFCIVILISGIYGDIHFSKYSWHISSSSSLLLILQVITLFGYFEYSIVEGFYNDVKKTFIYTLLLWVLAADIYILLNINNITDDESRNFLIGNKFMTSYSNLILICLFLTKKRNLSIIFSLIIITVFIAVAVRCSTALIGALLLVPCVLLRKLLFRLIYNKYLLTITSFLSLLFVVFYALALNTSLFQQVLIILDESSTLTGRIKIYAGLYDMFMKSPWLGYGNGNNVAILRSDIGYGNAQNGFAADLMDWGVFGVFALFVFIFQIIKSANMSKQTYYLMCLVYIYIIMGAVEITLGLKLIVLLSLVFLFSYRRSFRLKKGKENIILRNDFFKSA